MKPVERSLWRLVLMVWGPSMSGTLAALTGTGDADGIVALSALLSRVSKIKVREGARIDGCLFWHEFDDASVFFFFFVRSELRL